MRKLRIVLPGALAFLVCVHGAQAAEPVLVPDFTPGSTSEFAIAFMLQDQVRGALSEQGYLVLDGQAVQRVVGDLLSCADTEGCPRDALVQLPVRVAVVVRVERREGRVLAQMQIYEQADDAPLDERLIVVEPGNEQLFALEVASATRDVMSLLGPSPEPVLNAARALADGATDPPTSAPDPAPAPPPQPAPTIQPVPEPAPVPPPAPVDESLEALLDDTGIKPKHVAGSEKHLRKSAADPRDWLYTAMPHAGRLAIEVRGGLGLGDVDRAADLRIQIDEGTQSDSWFQEGPLGGTRVRGGLYLGYAPFTFLDIGVLGGLQYGIRTLTTGWRNEAGVEETAPAQSVQAAQLYLQPRVRGYILPVGPAKPYVFVGGDLRLFDKYDIEQPDGIEYPTPPAGIVPGAVGGVGLMVDPGPVVGFFAEGSYARHFGLRSRAAQLGTYEGTKPAPPEGQQHTIGIVGGVQFRI